MSARWIRSRSRRQGQHCSASAWPQRLCPPCAREWPTPWRLFANSRDPVPSGGVWASPLSARPGSRPTVTAERVTVGANVLNCPQRRPSSWRGRQNGGGGAPISAPHAANLVDLEGNVVEDRAQAAAPARDPHPKAFLP